MAYSIQAPGPHGPGYWLSGSPVSCRQLEADAGTVRRPQKYKLWHCFTEMAKSIHDNTGWWYQ